MSNHLGFITVAASNTHASMKSEADLICTGEHDELTIQKAIDICIEEDKNVYLYNGKYNLDGFYDFGDGGNKTAIRFTSNHRDIIFKGQNLEYGFQRRYDNGVVLYVTKEALDTVTEPSDVMRSSWTKEGIQNGSGLFLENFTVILDDNQHPVRCIDLRRTDRADVKNVSLYSYGALIRPDSAVGLVETPPVPANGCIGLTMTDGSNYLFSNYTNVQILGFDEGFQAGGEHVICYNCGAAIGNYGWTFGNYEYNCGANHPIVLINCMDERNINLPLFNRCGDKGGQVHGNQEVTMIGFNMEHIKGRAPGGIDGDLMREVKPGTWRGTITFSSQPGWGQHNTVDAPLWENDGSGRGFVTRNASHKTVCSTEERLSYAPFIGQQVFDTDLGKMLVCTDPENKLWVDFNGNQAD